MQIAVIGSGIAGLVSAYLLSKEHDVTLYERANKLGIHQHSTQLFNQDTQKWIDVPIRSIQSGYYEKLSQLIRKLDIKTVEIGYKSITSFRDIPTVSYSTEERSSYLKYKKHHWLQRGIPLPSLSIKHIHQQSSLIYQFIKLQRAVKKDYCINNISFKKYLEKNNYSHQFITGLLYPTLSMILTCNYLDIDNMPASIILNYFKKSFFSQHLLIKDGIANLAEALKKPIQKIFLDEPVLSIKNMADKCLLSSKNADHKYDHVIIASEATQAAKMITNFPMQEKILRQFSYQPQEVVIHSNPDLMPEKKSSWAELNIFKAKEQCASCTIWLNPLLGISSSTQYFQTWNPQHEVSDNLIISKHQIPRSIISHDHKNKINSLDKIQGMNNIWYCGSYASEGMALLENATESAYEVVRKLNRYTYDMAI